MPLIQLVVLLIVVGVLLWLMETYIPMNQTIKRIIEAVVIIVIVVWLLGLFGILPDVNAIRVGQ